MDSLVVDSLRHVVATPTHVAAVAESARVAKPQVVSIARDWFDWFTIGNSWIAVFVTAAIAFFAARYGARHGAELTHKHMIAAREQELTAEVVRREKEREEERKERRHRIKRKLEYILQQVFIAAKAITDRSDTELIPSEKLLHMREACAANESLLEDMHLFLSLEEETNIRSNLAAAVALAETTLENERVILNLEDASRGGSGSPNSIRDAKNRRVEHWKSIVLCRAWAKNKLDDIAKL